MTDRRSVVRSAIAAGALAVLVCTGCSDGLYTGQRKENLPPEVWLSSGPVESDTTSYKVHFYWSGWDPDGEISHFEFVVVDGDPIGFSPADTTGLDKWTVTTGYDSVLSVSADSFPHPYLPNPLYTIYDRTHTFFIRAVDLEGKRSEPATRSFTAWTLAPVTIIERPEGSSRTYSTVITFGWTGRDPIDSPANVQNPDSIRYMYSQVVDHDGIYNPLFPIIDDINENPEHYEDLWCNWISYNAPNDSGRVTILGDDEILELNRSHVFAVQAKDEAGAVTCIFQRDVNIRQFTVSWKSGPLLTITEQYLGGFQFLGTILNPERKELPPGIPLNFKWSADASEYGGEIVGYRYGWDVQDLDDPADWDVSLSPYNRAAPERILYSGSHTFFIQVIDNGGKVTLGRITVEIIPFSMERDLLWVDDFPAQSQELPAREMPSETQHDEFWIDICSKSDGFLSERDVYDCRLNNFRQPPMTLIGKYKSIIWTYSSGTNSVLGDVIEFTPESMIGQAGQIPINYLSIFLTKGGHLWTQGRSDGLNGGLAVIFPRAVEWPASFKHDMVSNPDDTSGVYCMGYKDYCISVVDKVIGNFKTGEGIPGRSQSRDALRYMYKDPADTFAAKFPGMPEQVELWEEITSCSGCFFNPLYRGFTYVEMYNSEYWMDLRMIPALGCFHPLYRMRTRSSLSYVDYTTVAVVITKYSNFTPEIAGGKAACSFHFGLPLWFFDHDAVDAISSAIFEEWGILAE